jgi:hypothetical protein
MGQQVDKTGLMEAFKAQGGPQTAQAAGRAERQAGQGAFKRRDIFSRSREVQQNLGIQRAERGQGAGVGNNKSAGIQLGG